MQIQKITRVTIDKICMKKLNWCKKKRNRKSIYILNTRLQCVQTKTKQLFSWKFECFVALLLWILHAFTKENFLEHKCTYKIPLKSTWKLSDQTCEIKGDNFYLQIIIVLNCLPFSHDKNLGQFGLHKLLHKSKQKIKM